MTKKLSPLPVIIVNILIKVLRAQLELAQVRQDIERRIAEKEDEFQVHTILRNFYIYLIQLI